MNEKENNDVRQDDFISALEPEVETPRQKQTSKKKRVACTVVFVIECLLFVIYACAIILFSTTVFQKADTLGDALGVIFGSILLLLPALFSFVLSLGFSIGGVCCRIKWIRIPSIVMLILEVASFASVAAVLFTK